MGVHLLYVICTCRMLRKTEGCNAMVQSSQLHNALATWRRASE
jgi:hypothetical protein